MSMEFLKIEEREGGIVLVLLDCPGQPFNTLSPPLIDEVDGVLQDLLADPKVRGIVIGSAKPGSFIAGADLKVLDGITEASEAASIARRGGELLERLAQSPKATVAAIDGPALGGGLEVALACDFLLATSNAETVLGLPEVQLGLLPGAGGTQRLPRRMGLTKALPLLLTGKRLRAKKAKRLGLVDALTTPGGLLDTATTIARRLADGSLEKPKPKLSSLDRLARHEPLRGIVLRKAREQARRTTRGLYPAPDAILDCVEKGLRDGIAAGLKEEAHRFGQLVVSPQADSLIRLFHWQTELKKEAQAVGDHGVRKLAILGAGFMGAGVASVSLGASSVALRDLKPEVLDQAAKDIDKGLLKQKRSYAIDQREVERRRSRLQLGSGAEMLEGADLLIEAVFEDLELKRRVLAEAEERLSPTAVFASNTSALPIGEIAANARHPERVLGMHYFSPVPKMPLLEIIRAPQTNERSLAVAKAYGAAQGKTVIVVGDGPGFYTTRILAPYINEAMLLLEEGARIDDIDRALKDFGFPVGPIALFDEVGIDVGAKISESLGAAFADRMSQVSGGAQRVYEAGYHGRKNRKGFYHYPAKGRKSVNEAVYQFFGGSERREVPTREIQDRLVLLMANEAVHCLGEGLLDSARDGDVGAVFGLGFAPFRGGPFRYLDSRGPEAVVNRLQELEAAHGPRFRPAPRLEDLAARGERFHS